MKCLQPVNYLKTNKNHIILRESSSAVISDHLFEIWTKFLHNNKLVTRPSQAILKLLRETINLTYFVQYLNFQIFICRIILLIPRYYFDNNLLKFFRILRIKNTAITPLVKECIDNILVFKNSRNWIRCSFKSKLHIFVHIYSRLNCLDITITFR